MPELNDNYALLVGENAYSMFDLASVFYKDPNLLTFMGNPSKIVVRAGIKFER